MNCYQNLHRARRHSIRQGAARSNLILGVRGPCMGSCVACSTATRLRVVGVTNCTQPIKAELGCANQISCLVFRRKSALLCFARNYGPWDIFEFVGCVCMVLKVVQTRAGTGEGAQNNNLGTPG
jgi:hypothetical protein